jgi:cell division protein FtsB
MTSPADLDPAPATAARAPARRRVPTRRPARSGEREPRRWGRYALVALVVAMLVNVLAGERGYLEYRALARRHAEAVAQLQARRAENEALRRRIRQLKSDPAAIEREIREQLGYVRPGEVVFSVREAPARPDGATPGRDPRSND